MRVITRFALAFFIVSRPVEARVKGPSPEPFLRIETGMHTAPISAIATDSQGRFLATGSDDKTIRIWNLSNGALISILKPPIGREYEGVIYAVAMTPDGELVAASGATGFEWDGKPSIYLFDRRTGRLVRRIRGLPGLVGNLAFSPDGRSLAVNFTSAKVLQVFRVADGKMIAYDNDYCVQSAGLDWDYSGRLVTSCMDGYVRLYSETLRLIAKVKPAGGKLPYSVSFSPDGKKVAVGFHDATTVNILSGENLQSLYRPDTSKTESLSFRYVTWSSDGKVLNAMGINTFARGIIRRWSEGGLGSFKDFSTGTFNDVTGIAAIPGGSLVFGASDPAWGLLSLDGAQVMLVKSDALDFRDPGGLSVDATGSRVGFGYRFAGTEGAKDFAVFSVLDRIVTFNPPADQRFSSARTEAPELSISGWKGRFNPVLAGKPLPFFPLELSHSLAISADGQSFLIGTSAFIHSFDLKGKERWKIATHSVTWAVNLSGDGRLAIAAFSDGTIRWYRADNGKELLAFFPHADHRRWVAWTPSGYYDVSVGGEDLIGWHVNRGPDEAADFFPVSRFRDRFYRPDIVERVLDTLDEATALAQADAEAQRKTEPTTVTKLLPPVVTIIAPAAEAEIRGAFVPFRVSVRSPSGQPVTAVRAFINGRPAGSARGLIFEPDPQPTDASVEHIYSLTVPIPPRDCTVAITAETGLATSEPVPVKLRWAAVPPAIEKPKLYLLAVGVGAYANPAFKLDLPAKDARDTAASWKAQKGGLYRDVEVKLLTDAQATKGAILDGLEWLERQTTEKDVAILYFSGHGLNDPRSGEYLFLPYEADLDSRRRTMLPQSDVQNVLNTIPGKVLVFLDTCHSGNLLGTAKARNTTDLTLLVNELTSAENGVVVFAASTGRQQARESPDWNNGAFTSAVLEALAGKADYRDNSLYVTELESYIDRRVKELTRGLQTPVTAKPGGITDFPVAVVVAHSPK